MSNVVSAPSSILCNIIAHTAGACRHGTLLFYTAANRWEVHFYYVIWSGHLPVRVTPDQSMIKWYWSPGATHSDLLGVGWQMREVMPFSSFLWLCQFLRWNIQDQNVCINQAKSFTNIHLLNVTLSLSQFLFWGGIKYMSMTMLETTVKLRYSRESGKSWIVLARQLGQSISKTVCCFWSAVVSYYQNMKWMKRMW